MQNEQRGPAYNHVAEVLLGRDGVAGDLGESHEGPDVRRIAKRDGDGEKYHCIRLLHHVLVEFGLGKNVESVTAIRIHSDGRKQHVRCWQT